MANVTAIAIQNSTLRLISTLIFPLDKWCSGNISLPLSHIQEGSNLPVSVKDESVETSHRARLFPILSSDNHINSDDRIRAAKGKVVDYPLADLYNADRLL